MVDLKETWLIQGTLPPNGFPGPGHRVASQVAGSSSLEANCR